MLKKLIALILCVLLVFSFAACKKDKVDDSSSNISSSDPTQDYDKDVWEEGAGLTEEEKEQLEDDWNKLVNNGGAEIQTPSGTGSDTDVSNDNSSDESSSESSTTSSDDSTSNGMGDSKAEIVTSVPSLH